MPAILLTTVSAIEVVPCLLCSPWSRWAMLPGPVLVMIESVMGTPGAYGRPRWWPASWCVFWLEARIQETSCRSCCDARQKRGVRVSEPGAGGDFGAVSACPQPSGRAGETVAGQWLQHAAPAG